MSMRFLSPMCLLTILGLLPVASASAEETLQDRLDELEDRLDLIERKTALDRVQFTGDYRVNMTSARYEGPSPDPYAVDAQRKRKQIKGGGDEIWSQRLRLVAKAEPHRSVRVTARMVMHKLFGDGDAPAFVQDSASTRIPRDSGLRLDRAWLDWFVTDWFSISVGRIAYSEGNPGELKEGTTARLATWGLQMVDGEYDSLNATVDLGALLPGFVGRLFYASWFNDTDVDVFGAMPFLSSGTDNLRIFGGNLEGELPGLGRNFFQLGYYIVPDFRPFTIPIPDPLYDPSADYTRAPAPLNNSLLFPSQMPDSLGAYQNISALLELYEVAGRLDLFVGGSMGFLSPNDKAIAYQLPVDQEGNRGDVPLLALASQGDKGGTYFVFVGGRYRLPIAALNNPYLGAEFNMSSQYHISFTAPTDNLVNKLATRGRAYESYLLVPINDWLFGRLSYVFIDQEYAAGFFGPSPNLPGVDSTAPDDPSQTQLLTTTLNASF